MNRDAGGCPSQLRGTVLEVSPWRASRAKQASRGEAEAVELHLRHAKKGHVRHAKARDKTSR